MERRPNPSSDDFLGLAPTRVQIKTVAVAPDELETVHDQASNYAARADIEAYLRAAGELGDEGTCLGDMVDPGAPRMLAPPRQPSTIEPKTVHAYCEPMLPFLPVEDLAMPAELELELEEEELYQPAPLPACSRSEDPILEYLREVSADFSPTVEPTLLRVPERRPSPHLSPLPMGPEPTTPEQAAVNTACVRYRRPQKSNFSARVLAVKKRRTPLWMVALLGALIAALVLTSSAFTVEVLASKLSPQPAETPEPKPWVMPR